MRRDITKRQDIKLLCVVLMAVLFMVAFTCCVNNNIEPSDSEDHGQVTLFTPPSDTGDEDETTADPFVTSDPLITMPPETSEYETTTRAPEQTTDPIETTSPEDTVYDNFSGLY